MNAFSIYQEFPDTFWIFKHEQCFLCKRAAIAHENKIRRLKAFTPLPNTAYAAFCGLFDSGTHTSLRNDLFGTKSGKVDVGNTGMTLTRYSSA